MADLETYPGIHSDRILASDLILKTDRVALQPHKVLQILSLPKSRCCGLTVVCENGKRREDGQACTSKA